MHDTHPDIILRLKRAEGHLRSIIGMIEQGKPCVKLAQQLHAVEAAVSKAKQELIHLSSIASRLAPARTHALRSTK